MIPLILSSGICLCKCDLPLYKFIFFPFLLQPEITVWFATVLGVGDHMYNLSEAFENRNQVKFSRSQPEG